MKSEYTVDAISSLDYPLTLAPVNLLSPAKRSACFTSATFSIGPVEY
jgi:hypothetical protein